MFSESNSLQFVHNVLLNSKLYGAIVIVLTVLCFTPLSTQIQSPTNYVFVLWGLLLLAYSIKCNKKPLRSPGSLILLLFLLANLITIALNYESNLKSNVIVLLCNSILLFLFYPAQQGVDLRKNLWHFNNTLIFAVMLVNIASLVKGFFLLNQDWNGFTQGLDLSSGRLWGVSTNPNGLAILAFIALCACVINLFLVEKEKGPFSRPVLTLCAVTCFVVVALTDARATRIALLVFTAGTSFLLAAKPLAKSCKKRILATLLSIAIGCACTAVTYVAYQATQGISAVLVYQINKEQLADSPDGFVIGRSNNDVIDEAMQDDITTGRVDIWLDGLQVFKSQPVFGVGTSNIADEYAKVNPHDPRANLHNGYLQILVANGLVGFGLFFAFGIFMYKNIIQAALAWRRNDLSSDNMLSLLIATTIVSLCVINMAESKFLFSDSADLIYLWFYVGTFMTLTGNTQLSIAEALDTAKQKLQLKA